MWFWPHSEELLDTKLCSLPRNARVSPQAIYTSSVHADAWQGGQHLRIHSLVAGS